MCLPVNECINILFDLSVEKSTFSKGLLKYFVNIKSLIKYFFSGNLLNIFLYSLLSGIIDKLKRMSEIIAQFRAEVIGKSNKVCFSKKLWSSSVNLYKKVC